MIDAYAHLGLPQFLSLSEYRHVMTACGIQGALLAGYGACPDLAELFAATAEPGSRLRVLGIAYGSGRESTEAAVRAQLAAGAVGLRLSHEDVTHRPWLLDILGRTGSLPFVCGHSGLRDIAAVLLDHLDRYPAAQVIAGHLGGPTDAAVFRAEPALARLYGHQRFAVVASRHGAHPDQLVREWTTEVIARVGWDRLMWGSEAPVLFWRGESIRSAAGWIRQFDPSPTQYQAFAHGNAARLVFSRPVPKARPLSLRDDPWASAWSETAPMWPRGLALDTALAGRLVAGWLAWGGESRGPLDDYVSELLDAAAPPRM